MHYKLCLFNFVFLAGLTFGETSNYLTPSKYSLQLRTNGLQDVSSLLPGTTISIKKMITSLEGIRISAGISAGSSSSENSSQGYGTGESKQNSLSFALYVTKLKYAYRNKNLYLYYGYGPFGKYSFQYSADSYQQTTTNIFSGGLSGYLGVEWFFYEHFSLFTEYSLNATMQYSRWSSKINGSNLVSSPTITKNFNVNSNSALIGFSIYL